MECGDINDKRYLRKKLHMFAKKTTPVCKETVRVLELLSVTEKHSEPKEMFQFCRAKVRRQLQHRFLKLALFLQSERKRRKRQKNNNSFLLKK